MKVIDCSCRGINSLCEKCFGRGYYDNDSVVKSRMFSNYHEKITKPIIAASTYKQVQPYFGFKKTSIRLINLIDSKSAEQTVIIALITSTKRKSSLSRKEKYDLTRKSALINQLEYEKILLKHKLNDVCIDAKSSGFNIEIKYNNYFSKKNYRS